MMKLLGISGLLIAATLLAGCQDASKRILFDGETFRAKARKVDKQRDVFEVTVRNVAKSPKGAREAAYHAGVSYCLASFGSSAISWAQDPLDEETPLNVQNNQVRFQGRCPQAVG